MKTQGVAAVDMRCALAFKRQVLKMYLVLANAVRVHAEVEPL